MQKSQISSGGHDLGSELGEVALRKLTLYIESILTIRLVICDHETRMVSAGWPLPQIRVLPTCRRGDYGVEPEFFLDGKKVQHALELALNASGWAILTAIERQRMSVMNVKGQLAEYYLNEYLGRQQRESIIESFEWRTDSPDFTIVVDGRSYTIECKNVRKASGKQVDPMWVETQRTRGGRKNGEDTRPYRVSDFDILAVALFNRIGQWDHWFIASKKLGTRPENRELLAVRQEMPEQPDNKWHRDILLAIKDIEHAK